MHGLRPYQQEAIDFLTANKRALLALPPGVGKTATIAGWLAGSPSQTGPLLVVCPNGPVLGHWHNEMWKWGRIYSFTATGDKKKRQAAVENAMRRVRMDEGATAVITNYECMRNDIDALLEIPWSAVVFDESHRLKNRKSLVFKAAGKLARRAEHVALVTGTPILNSADELWTSLHMLRPDRYKSFWRWAEHHFDVVDARYRGRRVREIGDLKLGHDTMLRQELEKVLISKPLSLILPDLPAVTETYLSVNLSSAERQMHDDMSKNFWMEHGGQLVTAPTKITQSLRLRQLASDWTAFGGEGLGAKAKAAVDLVNDLGDEQVVIFCSFRSTVDAICGALGPSAAPFHGGLSAFDRQLGLETFATGMARVIVGTFGVMSEGIDGMQVARNAIFVDRDWVPARNEQAVARLQRSGQRSAVNVTHLVATDTIDDVVAEALRRKRSVIKAVLEHQRVSA